MDRQTILNLKERRPFEPFAVQLSSGETYDVRHPELAALGKSRRVIFSPETDEMVICGLPDVTSLRAIQPQATS